MQRASHGTSAKSVFFTTAGSNSKKFLVPAMAAKSANQAPTAPVPTTVMELGTFTPNVCCFA
jgi:hypothetical protein